MKKLDDQGFQGQLKLAVLIDADNTQASIIDGLLAEVAKYGVASVKRIYGDWTSTNLRSWKDKLLEFAIQPVQQFSYTTGKNSTDSAMIIDAMDLLYTENLDGYCIVSSDSDFTRIAMRLREDGKLVLGFGQRKTPKPFVAACDKFIYTEILREPEEERESRGDREAPPKAAADIKLDRKAANLLRAAVEDAADEFGYAYLGSVGTYIMNRQPEFDPRNYGYRKLGDLIKASGLFDIDERESPMGQGKQIFIRTKAKGR
ncbi:MAG TPA: NYN domain-containing protein [Spirochaetia bacterium]|nr:NYN domain-containing protein [Spirochaetia bacterium]